MALKPIEKKQPTSSPRPIPSSDILILGRKNQATNFLLFDFDALEKQWGNTAEIAVYNEIPLNAVSKSDRSSKKFGTTDISPFEKIFPDKDIFTKYLFFAVGQNKFPGSWPIAGAEKLKFGPDSDLTPIVPLQKLILDFYSSEELSKKIKFIQKSDREIKVILNMTLAGKKGSHPKGLWIEKTYSKNEIILPLKNVPVIEIWPNMEDHDGLWNLYFTYVYAGGFIEHSGFKADPYVFEEKIETTTTSDGAEISVSKTMPEAFLCRASVASDDGNSGPAFREYFAGLILTTKAPKQRKRDKEIGIGIDFGTSNTQIYLSKSPQSINELRLEDRLKHITDPGILKSRLFDDFIPELPIRPPFRSLFKLNSMKNISFNPIADGIVYYPIIQGTEQICDTLISDLKWGQDTRTQASTLAFLEQLYLQCAAEANIAGASRISWKAAFPSAFSSDQESTIRGAWKDIVKRFADQIGYNTTFSIESESYAAAKYFGEVHGATITSKGAVCIDIGGGTSDIAIWHGDKNQLVNQASLLLAGRQILFDMAKKQFSVISGLKDYLNKNISLNKDISIDTANKTDFYAWIESFIKLNGNDIIKAFPRYADTDPNLKSLINKVEFSLSGLFSYIGLLIKTLGPNHNKIIDSIPNIFIGGNGSNLLKWNLEGDFGTDCQAYGKYSDVIRYASGLDDPYFSIEISKNPKTEVAHGLLSGFVVEIPKSQAAAVKQVISGESVIAGSDEISWNEYINSALLAKVIKFGDNPLSNFFSFLDYYSGQWELPLNTNTRKRNRNIADIKREMKDKVISKLAQKRLAGASDSNKIQVEPIYIIALKCFLENYCY
jgi:hypothetical protein